MGHAIAIIIKNQVWEEQYTFLCEYFVLFYLRVYNAFEFNIILNDFWIRRYEDTFSVGWVDHKDITFRTFER